MLRDAKQRSHGAGAAHTASESPLDVDALAMGLAGGLLAWYGITRFTLGGLLAAGVGGGLVCRSVHGDWRILESLGLTIEEHGDTAEARSAAGPARRARTAHGSRGS